MTHGTKKPIHTRTNFHGRASPMPIQSEHPRTSGSRLTDANGGRFINECMIGFGLLPHLLLVRASKNGDVRHRIYEQTLGTDVVLASVKASQKVLVGALPKERHRMSGRQVAQTVGRRKNHSTAFEVRESQSQLPEEL